MCIVWLGVTLSDGKLSKRLVLRFGAEEMKRGYQKQRSAKASIVKEGSDGTPSVVRGESRCVIKRKSGNNKIQ